MSETAVLKLEQREIFERNVTRSLVAGLAAGAGAYMAQKVGIPTPLTYVTLLATVAAFARGKLSNRAMLVTAATAVLAIPWFLGVTQLWKIALAGAAAGIFLVQCLVSERGTEGSLATHRPGLGHYIATALAAAGLTLAGSEVAKIISVRLVDLQTPMLLNAAVSGLIIALFASLASIVSHVALKADPVAARVEALIPELSPEFSKQMEKALALYMHCGKQLNELPREPAREELAKTLKTVVSEAAELGSQWSGVEAQLQDDATTSLQLQIDELTASANEARDGVARQQLQGAARSLKEELGRLSEIKFKRERVLAKLKSQVALLERAKVSLIGMRSSHATVRAAEMSAVSRRLSALAQGQSDESRLAFEVATANELTAHETAQLDKDLMAQVANAKSLEPVTALKTQSEPSAALPIVPSPRLKQ
jgi:hypothetical protein